MKNEKIVTLNGKSYDSVTGLPVNRPAPPKPAVANSPNGIKNIHSIAQRSQAIYDRTIKKPVVQSVSTMRRIGRSMDVARSKSISHFTPHNHAPAPTKPVSDKRQLDIKPTKHPIAAKVEQTRATLKSAPVKPAGKTAKEIKEAAIAEALSRPTVKHKKTKKSFKNIFKNFSKPQKIAIAIVAILLIGGYLIYLNIPSFSVKVASIGANVNAAYPQYHPDGYSFVGPVLSDDNEVTIKFRANTGSSEFSIKQTKSSWDSSALKDKINKDTNGEFIATESNGLTIYTYSGNASWVNGGILYTITGNAPLSSSQLQRIATSF